MYCIPDFYKTIFLHKPKQTFYKPKITKFYKMFSNNERLMNEMARIIFRAYRKGLEWGIEQVDAGELDSSNLHTFGRRIGLLGMAIEEYYLGNNPVTISKKSLESFRTYTKVTLAEYFPSDSST